MWIESKEHLEKVQKDNKEFLILMFYGSFSQASKKALSELERFKKENEKVPVYVVDVGKAKGLHKLFGVENVPTVLALKKGRVTRRIEGVESARFYANAFLGVQYFRHKAADGAKTSRRVVVYTGPGCPACMSAKAYLRRLGINFREVDVSSNQSEAQRLFQRSGQMAVPQIDIDGHLIVGFDKPKIDRLLLS